MTTLNLVTPKAGAKHELLLNKPASEVGLLKNTHALLQLLGVTKFVTITAVTLVTLMCCLSLTQMLNQQVRLHYG